MKTGVCAEYARELLERCLNGRPAQARLLEQLVNGDCSRELFGTVVEALSDSFEPALCDVYANVFSGILAYVNPGLRAEDLVARYHRVREARRFAGDAHAVRKVAVLSRVTLGADIAVTSVMLDGLKRRFPDAQILLAGSRKSWELFAGDPRIGHIAVSYPRAGTLRERLSSWPALQAALPEDLDLVVDPDSRLTQLGLLPVCDEEKYFFFESRSFGGDGGEPLCALASAWISRVFGVDAARPYIAPTVRPAFSERPVIAVSLGVGENPKKRVGDGFEERLLAHLAATGALVCVDSGAGGEEAERVREAVARLGEAASRVRVLDGSFAEFCGLIAASDLYVGYDSSGQHAAAAAGVPLVTIFAGEACERMFQRWRAAGTAASEVIRVSEGQPPEAVLAATVAAVDKLRPRALRSRGMVGNPREIAVVRALPGWGDMLCAAPALRALRAAAPRAHVALIGLPWARVFAARFPGYIDEFIEFPGYPGFPLPARPDARAIAAFLGAMQRRRFDLAIQMHGSGVTSNPFTAMLGARATAGAWIPDHYCPDPARFVLYDGEAPEVRRNLRIVERLGAPARGEELEFPLLAEDWEDLRPAMRAHGLRPGEYACVHPGASVQARRWPAERFAAVADALAGAGVRIVFTGSAAERPLIEGIRGQMKNASADLTGLTFGAMAALLSTARLLVANDTGVSHLASAFRVPSVVVFTAGDPRRWAPLDRARHLQVHVPADCRPCDYDVCPIGHPCALGVTVERVLMSARHLIREELACAS